MTTPLPDNILTGAQFSELTGLARGTISNALNKGKLRPARYLPPGKKYSLVNINHPVAKAYIREAAARMRSYAAGEKKRGMGSPARTGETPAPESSKVEEVLQSLPSDIRALADRSLRELLEQFGTDSSMVAFLKAINEMERVHARRLKNAKEEGTVVSRELVRRGVIEPFDLCYKRLLSDGARTIAAGVADRARAGESNEECEKFVAGKITDWIDDVKEMAGKVVGDGS